MSFLTAFVDGGLLVLFAGLCAMAFAFVALFEQLDS